MRSRCCVALSADTTTGAVPARTRSRFLPRMHTSTSPPWWSGHSARSSAAVMAPARRCSSPHTSAGAVRRSSKHRGRRHAGHRDTAPRAASSSVWSHEWRTMLATAQGRHMQQQSHRPLPTAGMLTAHAGFSKHTTHGGKDEDVASEMRRRAHTVLSSTRGTVRQ